MRYARILPDLNSDYALFFFYYQVEKGFQVSAIYLNFPVPIQKSEQHKHTIYK